ncbi:agmatinase family protein [Candidatus Gracilibacteria bacterium]|nr:agmatinase family protein [Candidatus Gracilibacteria bacterium]
MTQQFDPSSIGLLNGNLYGLPFDTETANTIVIPVPWDVTVSYRDGAHEGPQKMLDASVQMDLFDEDIPDVWKVGLAMEPISEEWTAKNKVLRKKAIECIDHLASGGEVTDKKVAPLYKEINEECEKLNKWVAAKAQRHINKGKMVCVLGGEHSVSLGLIRVLAEQYKKFSILHIDAHCDLRDAYEGFENSHASIMFNARKLSSVEKLTVVAVRDYGEQESLLIKNSKKEPVKDQKRLCPVTAFTDRQMKYAGYKGEAWAAQCKKIVNTLGKDVYISFDIDALDPALCPHTGTPVPGGLDYEQVMFLVKTLVESGRRIIGFDLSEVAPGVIQPGDMHSWDAVVGMRALYRMANYMALSQKK